MQNQIQRSRFKLYLIILITMIPVIVSWIFYHFSPNFSFSTSNHGQLIRPSVYSEKLLIPDQTKKIWQIAYMPFDHCQTQCQQTMFQLHQLRKAMGKNESRIGLLLVINNSNAHVDAHDFRKVLLNEQALTKLKNQIIKNIPQNKNDLALQHGDIVLIDPLGNIFMYYSDQSNFMDILKDLKHVLEVSQIG